MRIRNATLFSCIFLILAACHVDSVNMPTLEPSAIGLGPAFSTSGDCAAGYECTPATHLGAAPVVSRNLAVSCGVHFTGCLGTKMGASVTPDDSANYDALTLNCSGSVYTVRSNHGCWDCTEGCGGRTCPDGGQCSTVTIPGLTGNDCQGYRCDVANGWEYDTPGGFAAPRCRRSLDYNPPPPGTPAPPATTASVVDGGPFLTWDAVPGAAAYRVYRQLKWQAAPEIWYTWLTATSYYDSSTDVSGPPQSQPDGQWLKWARYHVVSLSADGTESSYMWAHYYPYTGTAPY